MPPYDRTLNLKPNKPGQPPANIPRNRMGGPGIPRLKAALDKALKMSPEALEKNYGFKIPEDIKGKKKQLADFLAARLIHLGLAGKVPAIVEIYDRVLGKANQPFTFNEGGNADLVSSEELPPELRIELAREMIAQAEAEIAAAKGCEGNGTAETIINGRPNEMDKDAGSSATGDTETFRDSSGAPDNRRPDPIVCGGVRTGCAGDSANRTGIGTNGNAFQHGNHEESQSNESDVLSFEGKRHSPDEAQASGQVSRVGEPAVVPAQGTAPAGEPVTENQPEEKRP